MDAYQNAISALPRLVAAAADRPWDGTMLSCALGAIAASKGYPSVAEAVLEMNTEVAEEFLKWHLGR